MEENAERRRAALRFVFFSLLGVAVFFVKVPVAGERRVPIDHMITGLKKMMVNFYPCLVCVLSGYSAWKHIAERKKVKTAADRFLFLQSTAGFAMSIIMFFSVGPVFLKNAGSDAVRATGDILCAILLSSLFVPLLLEYGLVDASGVLCRPVMRKLFRTPGSSAVIGVSAFLGNYSVGHVAARQMYDEGKFTEKEMVIVATGFSTCSIGLMLNLAGYLEIMDDWQVYAGCILLITFTVTAVTTRIFPIRRKAEIYREGVVLPGEEKETGCLLARAWKTGVDRAMGAPGTAKAMGKILVRIFPVICEVTGSSMFMITCALMLSSCTGAFGWLGSIFTPFLKIADLEGDELYVVRQAVGVSLFEPVLAGVLCKGEVLSLQARWIVGIVPYTSVLFLAGSVPSLLSSRIPCKIWEILLLWVERMAISILLAGMAGWILEVGYHG